MELLVHDVTEQILERLPPKSLLRFKSVSKQWKSTIESSYFQNKYLNPKNKDLLFINIDDVYNPSTLESIITLELESSTSHNIPIPCENNNLYHFCENSIDGLVCLYDDYDSVVIFNPTTRWYRTLPPSTFQQKRSKTRWRPFSTLGFGKDQITGLYKPVWLYNSSELGQNNNVTTTTICEVFDFNINAWRFIQPSSPKMISELHDPVYLNGLLYWLTEELIEEEENKSVFSFDLHTETFEIVCKTPFSNIALKNLNDNLCGFDELGHIDVIWSLDLEEKTWKKLYNIDLLKLCPFLIEDCLCAISPLAFMGENKMLMLFSNYCGRKQQLMIYDSETTSSHVLCTGDFTTDPICYVRSLISIL